jgi:hypothetical protein
MNLFILLCVCVFCAITFVRECSVVTVRLCREYLVFFVNAKEITFVLRRNSIS